MMSAWPLVPGFVRAATGAVIAAITFVAASACATAPAAPLIAAQLDDAVGKVMADLSIPGAVVGFWGPDVTYVRAFGVADTATRAPMQADMYTRIGSLTKTFTITALLTLIDQGKAGLDDPISMYVADVPSGDTITLRHLAQMQSGLVTYDGVPEFEAAFLADPQRTFTPQQLLGYALDKPLQFPPGTQYDYCNTNTVLLGLVVEKLSGQSLADYVRQHILVPLKLTHTSIPTSPAFPEPHPQGYTVLDGTPRVTTDWNPSWAWSNGNMISTLDDMRVWAQKLSSGELLSENLRDERFRTALPMSENAKYGVGAFDTNGWIGHSGITPGFETVVVGLPEAQSTLVVFVNTDVPHEVGTAVATAVTGVVTPDNVYR